MAEDTPENLPEGTAPEPADHSNYFAEQMAELGIDPATYVVRAPFYDDIRHAAAWAAGKEPKGWEEYQVFEPLANGSIRINYFDRYGRHATYQKKGKKGTDRYHQVRHIPGTMNRAGKELRYTIPREGGTKPFLPPALIEKYLAKEEIPVLILTEGAKKAAKGSVHGLDIIGLPSITHYKDSNTRELHPDIKAIVDTCKVRGIVWLHDGDARRIHHSFPEVEPELDLYKRPNLFYRTVWAVKNMFMDFAGMRIIYAVIKSEEVEGDPKGLDDLYVALAENFPHEDRRAAIFEQIQEELTSGAERSQFFHKHDVSTNMEKVRKWYHLDSVDAFYNFHAAKIRDKKFVWHGSTYQWDEKAGKCDLIIPREAGDYMRVGPDYYKWYHRPTPEGDTEYSYRLWNKGTIIDDHDKHFLKHIVQYDDFCNVPDHANFQPVISGCRNIYHEFKWKEREEGEWENIRFFLTHIFGDKPMIYEDRQGNTIDLTELDLGLDYIQLLYQRPTQKLPILCLVSQEKETGKTTFGHLLKSIFAHNAAWVGNADLTNDFNASWATKLLILCDEVLVEKKLTGEKIKALATNNKIMMNAKGKDQKEMDFFAKFVFFSNNERNFINTDKDETRFWVRKIRKLTEEEKRPHLMEEMYEEIPAFLAFLDKRKLTTKEETRAWFRVELIRTEALEKVIEFSQPTVEREIKERIVQMFEYSGREEILMTTSDISQTFFRGAKYEQRYIKESCESLGLDVYRNEESKPVTKRYSFPVIHQHMDMSENKFKVSVIEKPGIGRPWVFKKSEFAMDEIIMDPELAMLSDTGKTSTIQARQGSLPIDEDEDNDMPF